MILSLRGKDDHLCLSHAVQVQVPPVGNVRKQVGIIHRVTIQVHTLCLDEKDHIWKQEHREI